MNERLVFLSELDDDLQNILKLDTKSLLRRIYCYYLLSDGLILHPAYIWQSKETHEIILNRLNQIFRPPYVRTLLGDWPKISEYMKGRITKLNPKTLKTETIEYLQYKSWGKYLKEEASQLDKIFPGKTSLLLKENRDNKFRRLLISDFSLDQDNSLYHQLTLFIKTRRLRIDIDNAIQKINQFIRSYHLISTETISNYISTEMGLQEITNHPAFYERILLLYYYANIDYDMSASGITILGDKTIKYFDANVFWEAFSKIFGEKAAFVLSTQSDRVTVRSIVTIRNDELWIKYQNAYFNVLEMLDESLRNNANIIAKRIKGQLSSPSSIILQNIWQKHKLSIVGLVFGALSNIGGNPVIITLGGISGSISVLNILREALPRFINNYYSSGIVKVKNLINTEVKKVFIENTHKKKDS